MSYKGSYLISKCELIPNGSSLEEGYDIVRGNPSINYYESVTSPSISMTISKSIISPPVIPFRLII